MLHHDPRVLAVRHLGLDAGDGVVGGVADPRLDVPGLAEHDRVVAVTGERVIHRVFRDLVDATGDDGQGSLRRSIDGRLVRRGRQSRRRGPDRLQADGAENGGKAQYQGYYSGNNSHAVYLSVVRGWFGGCGVCGAVVWSGPWRTSTTQYTEKVTK
ncbi:hypothetical protein ACFFX0_00755 [Citricoccus parietis]|uniref:Uncharacterized protein n=1 Tax=Citricoccus parietis TaxID=592307 RepID=A0ABV5FT53_9MICC